MGEQSLRLKFWGLSGFAIVVYVAVRRAEGGAVGETYFVDEQTKEYGRQITEIESETGQTKAGQERQREPKETAGHRSQTESEKVIARDGRGAGAS